MIRWFGIPERPLRGLRVFIPFVLLAGIALQPSGAQEPAAASFDLAAMVLSPGDQGLDDYLHAGAFDESLIDEARIAATYRGSPDEEETFVALLQSSGFVRKHIATLQRNSPADASQIESIVRSYISSFHTADGAQVAFAALEDETGAVAAEDVPPSRQFGEEVDLTLDGGFDAQSRPFRSLDLTFRSGNLIGGVTLITYPGQSGFEPDQEMVEALGEILESRLASPAEASIGVSVARLDPAAVVTFDDAYYRLLGNDLPLLDETAEGSELRQSAYGDAETVYQLFQGLDGVGTLGGLYSLTLYSFSDSGAATKWMAGSQELISANDYYQNIEPVDADEITAEETLSYSFGPFGAPAKARMTLARIENIVVRVQLVPNGTLPPVPPEITASLVMAQIACIQQGGCVSIPVSPELSAYLNSPSATPEASPVP